MGAKEQRRLRNFMLQPVLQVRLGIYSILLALGFALLTGLLIYTNFYKFYDTVIELTDLREEVSSLLDTYVEEMTWWVASLIVTYLLLTVTVSVVYTHKLVGPTYAFRRHIDQLIRGEYSSRVILRKNDAFLEVAADLNRLAEHLARSKGT